MSRLGLHWQLTAALAHAGTQMCPGVGLEASDGLLYAYATDKYTIGIARQPYTGDSFACHLPIAEVKDLARMVKPQRVGERDDPVTLLYRDDELHCQVAEESAVFDTAYAQVGLDDLVSQVEGMLGWPDEDRELIYNPDLAARFGRAKSDPLDRMRLYPVRSVHYGGRSGAAVVTVGADFIGAVAGLADEGVPLSSLASWFGEAKAA